MKAILTLIRKEFKLEWRQKYALGGILLYVASTILLMYLAIMTVTPILWITLFWIVLLFASINALAKSFIQEPESRHLYYYQLASPVQILIAKLVYNTLLLLSMALAGAAIFYLLFGFPLQSTGLFVVTFFLAVLSFSSMFTVLSAITARAGGNSIIMPILSFPVIVPLFIMIIDLSRSALSGFPLTDKFYDIGIVLAINTIILALSILLFPYLWKD